MTTTINTYLERLVQRFRPSERELTTEQWLDKLLADARSNSERQDIYAMFSRAEQERTRGTSAR